MDELQLGAELERLTVPARVGLAPPPKVQEYAPSAQAQLLLEDVEQLLEGAEQMLEREANHRPPAES